MKLKSDEPVQLHHVSGDDQQRRVFFPGDEVPDDYIIPDRCKEAGDGDGSDEGNGAPGGNAGDDDELDEGDDDDSAVEGGGSPGPQPDGPFLDLGIDVESSSVQGIIDAVDALPVGQHEEAARWVLSEESRRPAPRTTLLNAMKKLLPS